MMMRTQQVLNKIAGAVLTGLITGIVTFIVRYWIINFRAFVGAGDFIQALQLARNYLDGKNPYFAYRQISGSVGYPLPIIMFGLPLAGLADRLAGSIFIALSSGLLAGGIAFTRQYWMLLMLLSLPYGFALETAQWSPLITSAWFLPVLAPMLVLMKPQIAAPIAINRLTKAGILLALVVLLASFIILPTWPLQWLSLLGEYEFTIPILAPGGFLLILSALRWREEKGRLLMLMSILPVRGAYDLLPIFLIPFNTTQMILLVIASWTLPFYSWHLIALAFLLLGERKLSQAIPLPGNFPGSQKSE